MNIVQELENSIDIVELVGKYVKLKKAGANYKSNCPFPGHTEKTPSFVVSPSKQLAYCFGCHKGGGAIKFIMDIENTDFKQALEILSQITGKALPKYEHSTTINRDIYQVFKDISTFYQDGLQKHENIEQYLLNRGITQQDIQEFKLGFSYDGRKLLGLLREKGYDTTLIESSKVFLDTQTGKDKFLGRIIFPLQNQRGDIIAFAGRVTDKTEPKYLNSPTTEIYDKSSILYGLFQGKKAITEKNFVIICEGYMDTISLHRAGFKNSVCVSGTALTQKHVQILSRFTNRFYLCFDNDTAGKNATLLSLEILKNTGVEPKIIVMQGGKDPDEIIGSGQNFQEFIDTAKSPFGYYLHMKSAQKIQNIDEKKKVLKEILELLKNYSDGLEVDSYLKEISNTLDVPLKICVDEFNLIRLKREKPQENKKNFSREETLIAHILCQPDRKTLIEKHLLFPNELGNELQSILQNPENIQIFQIERRDILRGLALEKEEKQHTTTQENQISEIIGLCKELNMEIGNKLLKNINEKIAGDPKNDTFQLEKIELARKIKTMK